MAIDQESFNNRLYQILRTRGYKPAPKDSKNERTNPETADVFEFQFIKDGENYGKAWATIDKTSSLNLYYDDNQAGSPPGQTKGMDYDDSWTGLLKHLKQWALSKQLNFGLHDSDRLGDDMRQRDYYKMKEKMTEGYHAVNKMTSYNDNIPNVKVVIQHDRQIGEGEQRWRNVHKIFVENTEGERFAVPTKMPGIARVYGRHVAEGGTPYDERGKHITALVEEYTKMAGFIRATRRGEFNESVAKLIAEGVNHHRSLKETLQKMQSHRGYNHYFESWTPPLMEDDSDHTSIAEMFAQESIDPRIESVLPILNKLNSNIINEIEEVNELDGWAKEITEMTDESIDEGIVDKAIGTAAEKIASNPTVQKSVNDLAGKAVSSQAGNINQMAQAAGKSAGSAAVDQVNRAIPGAVNTATDQAIDNLKGPAIATGAGIAGASGLAAYAGNKAAQKDNEKVSEGAMNKLVVDALEMGKEEFTKKYPTMGHRYEDIVAAFDEDDLKDKLKDPKQGELDLTTQLELGLKEDIVNEVVNRAILQKEVEQIVNKIKMDARGNQQKIRKDLKGVLYDLQDKMNNASPAEKETLRLKHRMLQKYLRIDMVPATNPVDAATKDADKMLDNPRSVLDNPAKQVTVGRAGAGIVGALTGMFEDSLQESVIDKNDFSDKQVKMAYGILNDPRFKGGNLAGAIKAIEGVAPGLSEHPGVKKAIYMTQNEPDQLEEFQMGSFDGDDDKPSKGKLVTDDGQEVILPLRTEDFRGDPIVVVDYIPPHKPSSTGRIVTDNGQTYFPGVAGLKIIGHEFDIDEALTGQIGGAIAGGTLGTAVGGFPGQVVGGALGAIAGDKLQDKVDDLAKEDKEDLRRIKKLADLGGTEDDDLADEESGKNHDPKTGKRIRPHPFDPEDHLDENIEIGEKGFYVNVENGQERPLTWPQFQSTWYDEFRDDPESRNISTNELSQKYQVYLDQLGEEPYLEETKAGGFDFAGDYKTGQAGQWKNTGKTKGRPAKVGDLVGAESKHAHDEMSVSQMSDEDLADYLNVDVKDVKADRDHAEEVANDKSRDHAPDNMLEDILRLSGYEKYEV